MIRLSLRGFGGQAGGRRLGIRNWECGLRPLGANAYAPAGMLPHSDFHIHLPLSSDS